MNTKLSLLRICLLAILVCSISAQDCVPLENCTTQDLQSCIVEEGCKETQFCDPKYLRCNTLLSGTEVFTLHELRQGWIVLHILGVAWLFYGHFEMIDNLDNLTATCYSIVQVWVEFVTNILCPYWK